MLFKTVFVLFGILACNGNNGAFANDENLNGSIPEEQTLKARGDGNASMEIGQLDSHEAMNNRDVNPESTRKWREKRSYEFLIGLVNNNSKYEVTRVDPLTTVNPETPQPRNTSASEALLELMVKIASHPEQWDRVHKLLQNIDEDLQASKKIVDDIQEKRSHTENHPANIDNQKRHGVKDDRFKNSQETVYGSILRDPDLSKPVETDEKIWGLKNITETKLKTNNWPDVEQPLERPYGSSRSHYKPDYFVEDGPQMKFPPQPIVGANRNQHRQFEYRVVTDRPFVHSKTPKAYIAVSVIAPKPMEPQDNDFFLENELRQLKPWPLQQEYQEPEPIQPRWIKKAQQRADEHNSP